MKIDNAFSAKSCDALHAGLSALPDVCWSAHRRCTHQFQYRHHNLYAKIPFFKKHCPEYVAAADWWMNQGSAWMSKVTGVKGTVNLSASWCVRGPLGIAQIQPGHPKDPKERPERKKERKTCARDLRYQPGDYSAPHNDTGAGRHVAFIHHLTKDWDDTWGGDMVWCSPYGAFAPSFNTLFLFKVSDDSFHFVNQVTEYARHKRLCVNGWFVVDDPAMEAKLIAQASDQQAELVRNGPFLHQA